MRAFEIQGGFGLEKLVLAELPSKQLLPGQVRIRVRAVSLNYRDLLTVEGTYNPKQVLPLIPCSDCAGEVVEIAPGVSRVKLGDRVMGTFAQRWISGEPTQTKIRSTLGGHESGVLAEEVVLYEEGLVHVPAHLSFAEAATLPCAAVTAWSALEQCSLGPGQTLVVQGTGGVSIFALQFAKLRGARAIVTSKSDEKLERAKALGADELVNYVSTPAWDKRVRELTAGQGAHVILEVGGAGTFATSVRAVRPGGNIALIGVLSGAAKAPLDAALTAILMQNIRVQGVFVGHREQFEAMCIAMEAAKMLPVIGETMAFEDAPKAFATMRSASHFGKLVLSV